MKLFKHSNGAVFAFGFDMVARCPDPHLISWSDLDGKTWEVTAKNCAGTWSPKFTIAPEFIFEVNGKIVAYQPGRCIEIEYCGLPYAWTFRVLNALPWLEADAA